MSGDVTRFFFSATEPPLGSVRIFTNTGSSFRILLAAPVEPDCDKDGFGDETQDSDLSACHPAQVVKKKKCKKQGQEEVQEAEAQALRRVGQEEEVQENEEVAA
jgi:hypothetical protein